MVFQRPNPLPISVYENYENVVFGLCIHSERRALTRAVLDSAVELPGPDCQHLMPKPELTDYLAPACLF